MRYADVFYPAQYECTSCSCQGHVTRRLLVAVGPDLPRQQPGLLEFSLEVEMADQGEISDRQRAKQRRRFNGKRDSSTSIRLIAYQLVIWIQSL